MKFAVVDLSQKLAPSDVAAYAAAQQRQLREHYALHYDGDGADDEVRGISHSSDLAFDESPIYLWPTTPAGAPGQALGFHDRLADGRPVCNVFLDLAVQYGDTWQSIASHEVLEVRADPRLHLCVELDNGEIWDREACDRVEADSYPIDGVPMSNFNTPACFEPMVASAGEAMPSANADVIVKPAPHVPHSPSLPPAPPAPPPPPPPPPAHETYDYLNLSTKPNEVRPGGYAQQYTPDRGWVQSGEMRGYRAHLAMLGMGRPHKRRARGRSRIAVARTASSTDVG